MIKHLQELLSIESVANHGENGTPYGAGPAKALEYMLTLCEQLGFRTKDATATRRLERAKRSSAYWGIWM